MIDVSGESAALLRRPDLLVPGSGAVAPARWAEMYA
jgi:hypothetical protein